MHVHAGGNNLQDLISGDSLTCSQNVFALSAAVVI